MSRRLGMILRSTNRYRDLNLVMIQVKSEAIVSLVSRGRRSGCGENGRMKIPWRDRRLSSFSRLTLH